MSFAVPWMHCIKGFRTLTGITKSTFESNCFASRQISVVEEPLEMNVDKS